MELRQGATLPTEITFLTQDEVRRLFAVITGKRVVSLSCCDG